MIFRAFFYDLCGVRYVGGGCNRRQSRRASRALGCFNFCLLDFYRPSIPFDFRFIELSKNKCSPIIIGWLGFHNIVRNDAQGEPKLANLCYSFATNSNLRSSFDHCFSKWHATRLLGDDPATTFACVDIPCIRDIVSQDQVAAFRSISTLELLTNSKLDHSTKRRQMHHG